MALQIQQRTNPPDWSRSLTPWNGNRRILVITGVDEKGFLNAFDRMLAPEPQTPGLTGNVLAVRSSQSGQLEAQNLLIQDPGNLPLAGRVFQAIDQLGIDLSLVAIALASPFCSLLFLASAGSNDSRKLPKRWNGMNPSPLTKSYFYPA